ncbi:NAD(P)H-dependent oxidoreductase [Gallaecimonas kandeliae]|uniref:flavodoxin family protein n=1 Tax=Gallaecimonas kandeliae TaxID=3029055 RepID=UPI0026492D96|nr:NAD(P)H-dependent oxidoreductase [Gallaecimonas kandeliae]WKE65756.1 NAD(P)H-dependent oxidoreductase [Gallaecimonas kandeliae]
MNTITLLGSARGNGYTATLAEALGFKTLNLNDFNIRPYDYRSDGRGDDFLPLVEQLLGYDRILFASPLYWYSMSGQMKLFLDRITDLLDHHKELGRRLRGKQAGVVATGGARVPPPCFEEPFRLTFGYLGMDYQGMVYLDSSQGLDAASLALAARDFHQRQAS